MEDLIFNVGTLIKSPIEADPRDFSAEAVLPTPTAEDLKNLPSKFSWGAYVGHTYYQNGYGSCVALGMVHSMLIQNVKEILEENIIPHKNIAEKLLKGENPIELIRQDLWTKMGHDIKDKSDSGDYVENGLKTSVKLGIGGKDYQGGTYTYFAKNYSYKAFGSDDYDIDLMKYYITKYPIICIISGNSNTWAEMMKGEVKTILRVSETTGAHCIIIDGYDEYGVSFLNSRTANDGTKKKCVFKVSYANLKKMSTLRMFNWRYRQLFDKKEAIVDIEELKKKLKELDEFEADVKEAIKIHSRMFDERTNSQTYKDQLHEMNNIHRGKLIDIQNERKKLVG